MIGWVKLEVPIQIPLQTLSPAIYVALSDLRVEFTQCASHDHQDKDAPERWGIFP